MFLEVGNQLYFDFIYNQGVFSNVEFMNFGWLIKPAMKEKKFKFEIKIVKPQGYIYYLEEENGVDVEKNIFNRNILYKHRQT